MISELYMIKNDTYLRSLVNIISSSALLVTLKQKLVRVSWIRQRDRRQKRDSKSFNSRPAPDKFSDSPIIIYTNSTLISERWSLIAICYFENVWITISYLE